MANCDTKYLGLDGKPSQVYYSALKKFGHEEALRLYVRDMFKSDIRFKAESPPIEKLEVNSKSIKGLSKDKKFYILGDGITMVRRVTEYLSRLPQEKVGNANKDLFGGTAENRTSFEINEHAIAKKKAKELYMRHQTAGRDISVEEEKKIAAEYNKVEDKWISYIKKIWKFGEIRGNSVHKAMEVGFLEIMDQMKIHKEQRRTTIEWNNKQPPGAKLKPIPIIPTFEKIIDNNWAKIKTRAKSELDKAGLESDFLNQQFYYTYMLKYAFSRINKFAKSIKVDPSELVIMPEKTIYNMDMNLGGTIDLLVVHPDSNKAFIIDIKTKTEDSLKNFDKASRFKMGIPWSLRPNNGHNMAEVQVSHYAAMLDKLGFEVVGAEALLVATYIEEKGTSADPNNWNLNFFIERRGKFNNTADTNPAISHEKLDPYVTKAYESSSNSNYEDDLEKLETEGFASYIKLWGELDIDELGSRNYYVKKRLNKIVKNETAGTFSYQPRHTGKKEALVIKPLSEYNEGALTKIFNKEYDSILKAKKTLTQDIIDYHRTGKNPNRGEISQAKLNAMRDLLREYPNERWKLFRAAEIFPTQFADLGQDVIVAIDEKGKKVSFISALSIRNTPLKFKGDGSGTRSSIWGRYLTDNDVRGWKTDKNGKRISANTAGRSLAKVNNLYMLKLGVAAMRWRKMKGDYKIENLVVFNVHPVYPDKTPGSEQTVVDQLRIFQKYAPEDEFPQDILLLMQEHEDRVKQGRDVTVLRDELAAILQDEEYRNGPFARFNITRSETGKYVLEQIQKDEPDDYFKLTKALIEMADHVSNEIHGSPDEMVRNDDLALINGLIMQYQKIDNNRLDILRGRWSELAGLRSEANAPDYYIKKFGILRDKYSQAAAVEFIDFHKEHLKLKEAAFGKDPSPNKHKRLFVDPNFTPGNEENWMKLKDPDKLSEDLTGDERAYIRFFNKHIKSALIDAQSTEYGKKSVGDFYKTGVVPLFNAVNKITWDINADGEFNAKQVAKDVFMPKTKQYIEKEELEEGHKIPLRNRLTDEITDGGLQLSDTRRRKLGIEDPDAPDVIPKGKIETNLDHILSVTKLAGLESKYMNDLNEITWAMITDLRKRQVLSFEDTKRTRDALTKILLMTVHNRFADEGGFGRNADRLRRIVSGLMFSLNIQQMATETFTGIIQGTSSMISNSILTAMGDNAWFKPADWLWAAGRIFTTKLAGGSIPDNSRDKVWVMAQENRILFIDLKEFGRNEFTKHKSGQFMKEALLRFGNTMPYKQSVLHTFVSIMHARGIDKAYKTDSEGQIFYDETYDPRFYVYNPDFKTDNAKKTEPKPGTEDFKKYQLWLDLRKQLKEEGMIREDGRMRVPLEGRDRKSIQTYATRLYGSMREDSRILWDFFALSRQSTVYKRWWAQKVMNYWTPTEMDESYGRRKWNEEEQTWVWQDEAMEGYLQTLGYIAKNLVKFQNVFSKDKMSRIQQENFSKLMGDVTMWTLSAMFVTMVWSQIGDDFRKSPLGIALMNGFFNAFLELNFAQTAYSMNGTIFPAVSTALMALDFGAKAALAMSTGNEQDALKFLKRSTSAIGLVRTAKAGYWFIDPDAIDTERVREKEVVINPTSDPSGYRR